MGGWVGVLSRIRFLMVVALPVESLITEEAHEERKIGGRGAAEVGWREESEGRCGEEEVR